MLVAAALTGCGGAKLDSNVLATRPDLTNYAPIDGVTTILHLVHPGQQVMLRVVAYNTGKRDIVLDKVELVDATGVIFHDAWTLDTEHLLGVRIWASEKDGWQRAGGTRDFAGTVMHPTLRNAPFTMLTADVTITGKPSDDVSRRRAVHVPGFRVSWHVGSRHAVSVLLLAFSGCFDKDFPHRLCPEQTPQEVVKQLRLQ